VAQDKYASFRDLEAGEEKGKDYDFDSRPCEGASVVVIAPHGGTIEPLTDKIADAIAGNEFSFYQFRALKPSSGLHIKSHLFDEQTCVQLVGAHPRVISIHGWGEEGARVCVGGLDIELTDALMKVLVAKGIEVEKAKGALGGTDPMNIANRGKSGRGVQFELTMSFRKNPALVQQFTDAVRSVLLADSATNATANQAEGQDNFHRLTEHLKEKPFAEKLVLAYRNSGASTPQQAMKAVLKDRLEQVKLDIAAPKA
jgi:phage replication-related protein YjqB (UPF0714/DUF867 family)